MYIASTGELYQPILSVPKTNLLQYTHVPNVGRGVMVDDGTTGTMWKESVTET